MGETSAATEGARRTTGAFLLALAVSLLTLLYLLWRVDVDVRDANDDVHSIAHFVDNVTVAERGSENTSSPTSPSSKDLDENVTVLSPLVVNETSPPPQYRACNHDHATRNFTKDDVVLVLMTTASQIQRMTDTLMSARSETTGNYSGDVVIMHSDEDVRSEELLAAIIRRAKSANFPEERLLLKRVHLKAFPQRKDDYFIHPNLQGHGPKGRGVNQDKAWIYFFKFNLFSTFFGERWCRVLYVDAGVTVKHPLSYLLDYVYPEGEVMMFSDSYPAYQWRLSGQFQSPQQGITGYESAWNEMNARFVLNIDYPNTAVMYFDTTTLVANFDGAITEELYALQKRYPFGLSMDQPVVGLYFTNVRRLWHHFPVFVADGWIPFDFCAARGRYPHFNGRYIMSKWETTCNRR